MRKILGLFLTVGIGEGGTMRWPGMRDVLQKYIQIVNRKIWSGGKIPL
jgi:hypothetical protein